jgi:hypothetical protein
MQLFTQSDVLSIISPWCIASVDVSLERRVQAFAVLFSGKGYSYQYVGLLKATIS